ncbi:MAG: hypothetical protein KKH32_14255 [Bacteroidetes bacterium]|nr:hypothetical protein [Bacteroidota bacterium]
MKARSIIVLLISFFAFNLAQAQVQVKLQQPPPNQLRAADLWKLTLNNTTRTTYSIRLEGTLDEAGEGRVATGNSGIISLPPGRKSITYDDVKRGGSVNFKSGKWQEAFTRTGNAPSGDYTICIYVKSEVDEELGRDCIQQRVEIMSGPILVSPADGETIPEGQVPIFTWLSPTPAPRDVNYSLKIVEVLGDQSPNEAMQRNTAWFERRDIRTTTLQYPVGARKFESGKKYAWKVSAVSGRDVVIESVEVFSFALGKEIEIDKKVTIKLISPTEERPAQNNRPTFEWKTEPAIEGITYTIVVREIEEGVDPESGKILFERSGIRETILRYPAEIPALDTAKVYVWKVTGIKDGKVVAVSQLLPIPWPWYICWLIPNPPTQKICLGSTPQLCAWAIMFGTGISGPYTWSLTDPNGPPQTGSSPAGWFALICVSPTMPTTPGVYTYTLTVTRGTCTRTVTFTVNVYPNLTAAVLDYPSGNPITDLCWGDDATVNMNGVPPGCSVTWYYRDLPISTWTLLGTGNPYNTNQIKPTCSPGQPFVIREFKGKVSCTNMPTPWPTSCPDDKIVSLQVWCPTQPGTISVSPGTQICSNNNYPVNVTSTVTGYVGTILGWTVNNSPIPNSAGQSTITYSITSAGNYTFCVQVKNGTCQQQQACILVKVEDPITAQITSNKSEVCWGKDAQLTLTHNGPPGTQVQWQYQINCAPPWITTGNTGTVQNTNELFGPSYPGINPPQNPPCVPDKICWRAIVSSPTGICPPTVTAPLTINVIQPPTKPTISPPGPLVKCPNTSVTLTASTPACGTPPFTYQWYLNGLPVAAGQTIQATQPGNYFVVVYNKNNCDSAQSKNTVTVRDCSTKVVIQGPCTCSSGTAITLTAIPTSFVVPPGPPGNCGPPYTYLWSTGATTQSIIIPCPQQTTTLWVEVTNAMGCKTKVYHTIKRCP